MGFPSRRRAFFGDQAVLRRVGLFLKKKRATPFGTEKRRGPLKRVPKGSLLGPFWDPFGTIRSNRKGFSRFLEGSGGRLGVSWGRSGGFGCGFGGLGQACVCVGVVLGAFWGVLGCLLFSIASDACLVTPRVSIEAHLAILGASSPPIGLGGMREAL